MVAGLAGHAIGQSRSSSKSTKEKKDLLQYIQLQDEIYKARERQWTQEYKKLYSAYEELEKETVERDYEEFKAPDTNNDDKISRSEFNVYVKKYLSSFPELSEKDFPKFDEFDLNGDGIVSFEEWQKFLYQQKLQEAKKGKGATSSTSTAYADLLNALYEQTNKADSFNRYGTPPVLSPPSPFICNTLSQSGPEHRGGVPGTDRRHRRKARSRIVGPPDARYQMGRAGLDVHCVMSC